MKKKLRLKKLGNDKGVLSEHEEKLRAAQESQEFLERISGKLVSSFDQHITLQEIAKLVVSYIADYSRIAVVDDEYNIREIAASHVDPTKISLTSELYENYKNIPNSTYGIHRILKTGKSEIIEKIDKKILDKIESKKLLEIINKLKLKSYIGVPLIARGKVIGAITFSSIRENRYYGKKDLKMAEEVARRIALTIDNIRLFEEVKNELRERKKIEERLKLAQSAGNIGAFDWDMVTDKLYWSPELKVLYGLTQEEADIHAKAWRKLIHPEDRKRIDREFKTQVKKGETEFEFRIIWPDKSVHWIYSKAKIIYDDKKRPVRSVGINADITHRKLMESNLKYLSETSKILSSSLDYETTLENVAQLAVPQLADWCTVDIAQDGKLRQLALMHRDSKKVKWAKEIRKKYPPDINAKTGTAEIIRTGKSQLVPYITPQLLESVIKDKEYLELIRKIGMTSVMQVPIKVRGKTIGAISFISAEMGRHYSNEDVAIAEEVANRAGLAIENSRLYTESQKAITLRDDFISIVSHELKTPVTSLKMYAQVVQRKLERRGEEILMDPMRKIDSQINKLTSLISDLLSVSRMKLGKLNFHEEYFDLQQVLEDVVEGIQPTTKRHLIKLEGNCKKKIWGDPDRIGQVLNNLLTNAIKYSPKADKVLIKIQEGKKEAKVTVRDFGIGIDKKHQGRIFERFYRVGMSDERTFPGLGIGLYISNEIVKRHGGMMIVDSVRGKGSQFSFTLPYKPPKRPKNTLTQS